MNARQAFIIEDLDDYHVIIKADEEYRVRSELDTEVRGQGIVYLSERNSIRVFQLEKNTYSLE